MKLHSFKGLDLSFLQDERRKIVFDNLNAAKENGYYEDLSSLSDAEIVGELQAFAEDCQDLTEAQLTPHVQAWLTAQSSPA